MLRKMLFWKSAVAFLMLTFLAEGIVFAEDVSMGPGPAAVPAPSGAPAAPAKEKEEDPEEVRRKERLIERRKRRRLAEEKRMAEQRKIEEMHRARREAFAAKNGKKTEEKPASSDEELSDTPKAASPAAGAPAADQTIDLMSLEDGYYLGEGKGYDGPIKVYVKMNNGHIRDVRVYGENESRPRGAFSKLGAKIKQADSPVVDGITGATVTSQGFLEAVSAALKSKPRDKAPARIRVKREKKKDKKNGAEQSPDKAGKDTQAAPVEKK